MLDSVFGDSADDVKQRFLQPSQGGIYHVKAEYDTQRKVAEAMAGDCDNAQAALRDGLCQLLADVLFLPDRNVPGRYHPRIGAQQQYIYDTLGAEQKAFDTLYDDYFQRRNTVFWYRAAMKKIPTIVHSCNMLPCAEDLGLRPECVDWTLRDLRMLSLEMPSMPKQHGSTFADERNNPYLSVCTTSNHDTPTLRQQWDADPQLTQAYFTDVLRYNGMAPHPMPGWLARDIVARQLACPSMFCVLPLQDWLAMDERLRCNDAGSERVNRPSDEASGWRWRMHISIGRIMQDTRFCDNLRELIDHSGRNAML